MTVCRMWVKASNTLEGCEVSIQLTQNYAVGDCVIILLSHPPPKKKKKESSQFCQVEEGSSADEVSNANWPVIL